LRRHRLRPAAHRPCEGRLGMGKRSGVKPTSITSPEFQLGAAPPA
jgi:hypothetical protein